MGYISFGRAPNRLPATRAPVGVGLLRSVVSAKAETAPYGRARCIPRAAAHLLAAGKVQVVA